MKFTIKQFDALTTKELHEIYQVRSAVFVVEQQCVYQDIDATDLVSYHMYGRIDGKIVAYCRLIPPHVTFDTCSIGRVLVTERRKGYATHMLQQAISMIYSLFDEDTITIEAQTYVKTLYERCGFVQTSAPFLEDGIEHIQMKRNKNAMD